MSDMRLKIAESQVVVMTNKIQKFTFDTIIANTDIDRLTAMGMAAAAAADWAEAFVARHCKSYGVEVTQ